jgi:DNA repair protein RadC
MGKRHLESSLLKGTGFNDPTVTQMYFKQQLRPHLREVFACLFLDNQHRMLAFEELFYGTINQATIHPREIVRRALHHNAAAVIIGHNHPSGVAEPSLSDIHITRHIKAALQLIDVRLLDHIIVGDSQCESMLELGLDNNPFE